MRRAIDLAELGKYTVSPNPRVGAVIVHDGQIIGEGFHQQFGEAHAEVNAIHAVKDQSLLAKSSLYVTLEPCSHFGKTPPCADLIVKHKIPRVVIANQDPFEKVAGSGIEQLKEAGVEVSLGVLAKEGEELNKRFFTFHRKKRPYIILKWAETKDGYIGRNATDPNKADSWITNAISKQLVHQWRAEEDAILVGKNTVLTDNPELTVREVKGSNPIRLIIDSNCELVSNSKVFNELAETIVLNGLKEEQKNTVSWIKTELDENLMASINQLAVNKSIQSILVEGGASILQQFIDSNNWDEARVFRAQKEFGAGIKAPIFKAEKEKEQMLENDQLSIYLNKNQ